VGVLVTRNTLDGGVTPICNDCGIVLCYDISEEEYQEAKEFWDVWRCNVCNPEAYGSLKRYREEKLFDKDNIFKLKEVFDGTTD